MRVSPVISGIKGKVMKTKRISLMIGEDQHQQLIDTGSTDSEIELYLKKCFKEMLLNKIKSMEKLHKSI